MAVATSAAIIGGISAAGGIAKTISGAKRAKKIKEAQAAFRRQKLTNVHQDRRVSTAGADLAREESQRSFATGVEAARSGGIRGLATLTGMQENANTQARQIGAGLDQQQVDIDRDFAADEQRIQGMQEQRDNAELSAMQAQANAAQQDIWSGVGDIASGAATMGAGLKGGGTPFDGGAQGLGLDSIGAGGKTGSLWGEIPDTFTGTLGRQKGFKSGL